MAELHYLSAELENFRKEYDGSDGFESAKNADGINSLVSASAKLEEAYSKLSTAASDTQGTDLSKLVDLAKSGIDSIKTNIPNDVDPMLQEVDSVRTNIIQKIMKLYEDGKAWKPGVFENIWDETIGALVKEWRSHDRQKIDKANKEIDRLNKKGWDQLNAISSAINSADFKIVGNMVKGGSVGSAITFMDNYTFTKEQWEKDNPTYELGFLRELGCAVVGLVESVVKVGEGVGDAVLTVVAGAVSIIDSDAGNSIKQFAAKDVTGDLIGGTLGAAVARGSKEAYDESSGRAIGSTIGNIVAHGALWSTGAGAVVSALSVAGNSEEYVLQSGGTIEEALLKGTLAGAATYVGGHAIKALGNKFHTWVTDPTKGGATVVGKAYSAVSTPFGKGWNAATGGFTPKGIVAKTANIAVSPVRGLGKGLGKTIEKVSHGVEKVATKTPILKHAWSGFKSLDATVDRAAAKIVHSSVASANPGASTNTQSSGTTQGNPPSGSNPASGTTQGNPPSGSNPASGSTPANPPSGSNPASGSTPANPPSGSNPASGSTPANPPSGSNPASGTTQGNPPSGGSTASGASTTTGSAVNNPSLYGINQEAFDELVSEGFTPGTKDFINEAINRFAGAVVPNNPGIYGINQEAFDELVSEGFTPGTKDFINEARLRFVGTSTASTGRTGS